MTPPICVPCGLVMRCFRNGQPLAYCDRETGEPAVFYYCDVYACPQCGGSVAVGLGTGRPLWDPLFEREIEAAGDDLLRVTA